MKTAILYTPPRLVKGPKPTVIKKGSTLEAQWANQPWHIEYHFNGIRYRKTENMNRIKDHGEKLKYATNLLEVVKQELEDGYNPENPTAYLQKVTGQNITLAKAVDEYLEDVSKYLRGRSIDSYTSKLRYLVEAYPTHFLKDITAKHIENYLYNKIHKGKQAVLKVEGKVYTTNKITRWTPATVEAAKTYFTTFFNWCKHEDQGYITKNPVQGVNERKIRSEVEAPDTHVPYTTTDLKTVLTYLDEYDKYMALFCRAILYTCIRPKELRALRVADVNLTQRTLRVGMDVMKATSKSKADTVHLDHKFITHLEQLNLSVHPTHYLFSNDFKNVVGNKHVGVNTPYNRLMAALEKLGLDGKGYGLYSFKHTSNIQRYNAGWSLVQIMKANRHTSIQQTEKYLKKITRQTDITDLEVPEF